MTTPAPQRIRDPHDWDPLVALLRDAFAYMEGRIDPPSSIHRLTPEAVARQASDGEVWAVEEAGRPVACLFLSYQPGALYLGKLAVARSHRGRGLARHLVDTAAARARALNLSVLRLQTRIELTENHAAFAAMGFAKTGETAHEGYDRPTSIIMQRPAGEAP